MSVGRQLTLGAGVSHLRPRDSLGATYFGGCLAQTVAAVALSHQPHVFAWLAGQILLALTLVQWFVLLHEAGHGILFRSPRWNEIAGQVSGFFSFIPFESWTAVHNQHHRWTGWQDLDPTTAALVPRELSRLEKTLVDVCWRLWIPLFLVIYRVNNFWNWPRLKRLIPDRRLARRFAVNMLVLAALYAGLVYGFGAISLLKLLGVGIFLSMVFLDSLILSQHTHIPMTLSQGSAVEPYSAPEQDVFSRSLRFPRWFSQWFLVNVDAHELHHVHPQVPGYLLGRIDRLPKNLADGWRWFLSARRLPGTVFLFQNRTQSGSEV